MIELNDIKKFEKTEYGFNVMLNFTLEYSYYQ